MENDQLKYAKNAILIIIAIWDAYTTLNGLYVALHHKVLAVVLTCFVNGTLFFTFYPIDKENEFVLTIARITWVMALVTDFITAFHGNKDLVLGESSNKLDLLQNILVGVSAAFTCVGTIYVSYVYHHIRKKNP